jgi:hypothetical protein
MIEYKNFKWAEIIEDESQITKTSALYMIPVDNTTFRIVVADEDGNRRTIFSTGQPGENATIEIGSVEKLPPDGFPTVNNIGTDTHAILEFGIPQGGKGDPGEAGDISAINFEVNDDMHLIMQLETNTNLDFILDSDGHLILTN